MQLGPAPCPLAALHVALTSEMAFEGTMRFQGKVA